MRSNRHNSIPIITMVLLFGMISFVTNLAAPMGIVIKEQFHVSNSLGMLGNFANFLAYAIMGIPAGKLLEKIGYKRTALLAILIGFLGIGIQLLSGALTSFSIYLSGAFLAGFSMCMLNTVVNPMLNILGGGGKKGNQFIQIGGTFSSLMGILVPVLVGILIGEVTKKTTITDVNPVLFIAMGVFAVIGIVLLFINFAEPRVVSKQQPTNHSSCTPFSFRHFVLGIIAIFISVGVEVGIPSTMNFFLIDSGLSAVISGMVVGTFFIMMLAGRLLSVFLAKKISSKLMLSTASVIGIILVFFAITLSPEIKIDIPVFQTSSAGFQSEIAKVPINAVFLVLTGLCTSVMWGNIFNLAIEGLGKYVASASGIFMTMVCGGGILPFLQNVISDKVGYMPSFWLVLIGFLYLFYYALRGSENVNKDIPV